MSTKQARGFSPVVIIVAIVAVLIVGLIAWRIYDSSQAANQANSQNPQANNNEPQQEKPAEQPAVDPNEGYVVIKEWGVRFKPVAGLTGVQYFQPSGLPANELTFTTAELSDISQYCRRETGNIILGLLTRSATQRERAGGVVAKIGDYYYQYAGPQAACTESSEHDVIESQATTSLSKSLDSLEAAK